MKDKAWQHFSPEKAASYKKPPFLLRVFTKQVGDLCVLLYGRLLADLSGLNSLHNHYHQNIKTSMLGNRDGLESGDIGDSRKRILIESLRFLKERNEEEFKRYKQELEGTDLWKAFQREYGE